MEVKYDGYTTVSLYLSSGFLPLKREFILSTFNKVFLGTVVFLHNFVKSRLQTLICKVSLHVCDWIV